MPFEDRYPNLFSDKAVDHQVDVYKTPRVTYIGDFPIDVLREERYSIPFDVTIHPVEDGSDMTDHIDELPSVLILGCTIGNDIPETKREDSTTLLDGAQTWKDKFNLLLTNVIRDKTPKSILTSKQAYNSMVCRNYSDERRKDKTGALFFTLEFVHVSLVSNQVIKVSPESIPKEQKTKNSGKVPNPDRQAAKEQNLGKKEPFESDLSKLISGIAGSGGLF